MDDPKSAFERYVPGTETPNPKCKDGPQKDATLVLTYPDGTKHYVCEEHAFKYFKGQQKFQEELLFLMTLPK
jgi:hypothetical protein